MMKAPQSFKTPSTTKTSYFSQPLADKVEITAYAEVKFHGQIVVALWTLPKILATSTTNC
jgi:hypothetical protein